VLNTTAIIVSYNTADLLRACYNSIRKFYPELPVIIIDGSHHANECFTYSKSIADKFTRVANVEFNIGHGPGMKLGIGMCQTNYFLLIDSDVTIDKAGVIEGMEATHQSKADTLVYGCGKVVQVNETGNNVDKGINYLHPYFALINKTAYLNHEPFINHGAPLIKTMLSIFYPNILVSFPVDEFVTHKGRGTRELKPKEFTPGYWDKL